MSDVLYFTEDTQAKLILPGKNLSKLCNIFGLESLSGKTNAYSIANTKFIKIAYLVEMKEIFLVISKSSTLADHLTLQGKYVDHIFDINFDDNIFLKFFKKIYGEGFHRTIL